MDDLTLLEQLLQNELIDSAPSQVFKSSLKQKLLDRSAFRRKKVLYQWLGLALVGMVAGVALYGLAMLLQKKNGRLLCCESGNSTEGSS